MSKPKMQKPHKVYFRIPKTVYFVGRDGNTLLLALFRKVIDDITQGGGVYYHYELI